MVLNGDKDLYMELSNYIVEKEIKNGNTLDV